MPEFTGLKQSNKTILMKVTSRERPDQLLETVRQYIDKANNTKDMVWLFSFDIDDQSYKTAEFLQEFDAIMTGNYIEILTDPAWYSVQIFRDKSTGKIDAINRDVKEFSKDHYWDILLNISDDQRPIVKGYDDIIRRAMPDDLDASLWFTDGQPRVNTQEIIGWTYYNRFGYIYHPDFKSLWCDNLSTDMALFLGKCVRSNKQIVKHVNPAWGGVDSFKMDALYERNNKFWDQDEATYKRIISEGLDKLIKQ